MALIGTGIDYYTIVNESVTRNSDKPYDLLKHNNIFEIQVSQRPIYATKNNPENIIYTPTLYNSSGLITQNGDYELVDGRYIVWRSLSRQQSDDADIQLKLENVDTNFSIIINLFTGIFYFNSISIIYSFLMNI